MFGFFDVAVPMDVTAMDLMRPRKTAAKQPGPAFRTSSEARRKDSTMLKAVSVHFSRSPVRCRRHQFHAVTFNKDVLPILQNRCQECHREGEVGPLRSWITRDPPAGQVHQGSGLNQEDAALVCRPARYGHFSNDHSLSKQEIDTMVGLGGRRRERRRSQGCAQAARVLHRLADRQARHGAADAQADRGPGPGRSRVHLRRPAHRLHRRQVGPDGRSPSRGSRHRCITSSPSSVLRARVG